jgi:hypothetical protein
MSDLANNIANNINETAQNDPTIEKTQKQKQTRKRKLKLTDVENEKQIKHDNEDKEDINLVDEDKRLRAYKKTLKNLFDHFCSRSLKKHTKPVTSYGLQTIENSYRANMSNFDNIRTYMTHHVMSLDKNLPNDDVRELVFLSRLYVFGSGKFDETKFKNLLARHDLKSIQKNYLDHYPNPLWRSTLKIAANDLFLL